MKEILQKCFPFNIFFSNNWLHTFDIVGLEDITFFINDYYTDIVKNIYNMLIKT